ncbi:hypothetical protein [Streptomyces eurythermus]
MTFGELRRLLNTVPITADNDPVFFLEIDAVGIHDVTGVRYEAARYDEWGGLVDEPGGTVWLTGPGAE